MRNPKHLLTVIEREDLALAEQKEIDQAASAARGGNGLAFRENRVQIPKELKCVLIWKDNQNNRHQASVLNLSKYGCRITVVKNEFNFPMYTRFTRAEITIDDVNCYRGPITFVNEGPVDSDMISVGITLESKGCDFDVLAAAGAHNIGFTNNIDRVQKLTDVVTTRFKELVADLNIVLQELNHKLEQEAEQIEETASNENHKRRLEERVINMALSVYRPIIQNILKQFQETTSELDVDSEHFFKQYFRLTFQSLLKGTPFVNRGLRKPLGYSGDYGMMVMLYEYIDQGHSLFHKFFHRYVCSEPTALANRNRVEFLSDILIAGYMKALSERKKRFKVVSLACGPAREIYEFLSHAPIDESCSIEVILVDSEDHALDFAQKRLKELPKVSSQIKLTLLKEDVVTGCFQPGQFLSMISDADFIVSAGLFDYLTERVSKKMISQLYSCLSKNGELLIGNISKKSPDTFAMDYFMDWRLILRDEDDLLALVTDESKSAGAKGSVIAEALGLNLFLRVVKET